MAASRAGIFTLAGMMLAAAASGAENTSNTIRLFNGADLTGWNAVFEPGKNIRTEDVWSVRDGVLICQGKPTGYIRTERDYGNYVLRLQWRWSPDDKGGRNSGVFVHVVGSDHIWPKGAEAQLASGAAGDFWLIDNYRLTVDPARKDPKSDRHWFRLPVGADVEKPIGEWNDYEITCRNHDIELKVNGTLVNRGTDTETTSGAIILQSEGAEIHFRNLTLSPLE